MINLPRPRLRGGRDRDALHRTSCGSRGSTSGPPRSGPPTARRRSSWTACGARYVSAKETPSGRARGRDGRVRRRHRRRGQRPALARRAHFCAATGSRPARDRRPRPARLDPGPGDRVEAILGNRALFGSVNANLADWHAAVERLDAARRRWPDALDRFVGLRTVPLDAYADAFAFPRRQGDALAHQLTSEARRIAARSSGPASRGAITSSRCCLARPRRAPGCRPRRSRARRSRAARRRRA